MTSGDRLYTDVNSLAEMRIGSTSIRLAPRTNFQFLNLDDRTVQISVTSGAVNIRVRHLPGDEVYEVDTPNGAATLLRSGEYRVDTDPDRNETLVTVRAGEAEVTANGTSFPVHPRETGYFSGDYSAGEIRAANARDRFDDFASQRDRREDLAPAPRYVSRDMVGYEDLDGYGSWSQNAEYGPLWRPRVASGWAPYRDGRWAWVEPWGWTWIDNEPWGFAPSHYGRWAYLDNGWGWFPGPADVRPVYAPALVAFLGGSRFGALLNFGGGDGVGWFPLGPREIYRPSYHVSDAYVNRVNVTNITNVTNINVNNINVNNVRYVNQTVPGAVSAVSRQDFVNSHYVRQSAVAAPVAAVAQAQIMRSAQVVPQQQSVLVRPAVGGSMQIARPPAAVMNRQIFVRSTPPPPPVPFVAKQQALAANPGQPVAPAQIQSLRQTSTPVARPYVRSAMQPAPAGTPIGTPAAQRPVGQPAQPPTVPFTRQPVTPNNIPLRRQADRPIQATPAPVQQQQRPPVTPAPGNVPFTRQTVTPAPGNVPQPRQAPAPPIARSTADAQREQAQKQQELQREQQLQQQRALEAQRQQELQRERQARQQQQQQRERQVQPPPPQHPAPPPPQEKPKEAKPADNKRTDR